MLRQLTVHRRFGTTVPFTAGASGDILLAQPHNTGPIHALVGQRTYASHLQSFRVRSRRAICGPILPNDVLEPILAKSTLRVLIVDDYEPFRQFIATKVQTNPQLRIVKEACDGAEAIQQAQELQPDLVLLDIGLPTLNGIEAARRIREVSPASRILFVTENRSTDFVEAALSTGAGGYVVKSDAGSELLPAIEAILRGKQFVGAWLNGRNSIDTADRAVRETVVAGSRLQSVERHELRDETSVDYRVAAAVSLEPPHRVPPTKRTIAHWLNPAFLGDLRRSVVPVLVVLFLVLEVWITVDHRPVSSRGGLAIEKTTRALPVSSVSSAPTRASRYNEAQPENERAKTKPATFKRVVVGPREIDYVAEDVTIRHFDLKPALPQRRTVEKILHIGEDVTVRYFEQKPSATSSRPFSTGAGSPERSTPTSK